MTLAIDVHYKAHGIARAVGILFHWNSMKVEQVVIESIADVQPYISGQFYKRELPCVMAIIRKIQLSEIEAIIVDGHVYIDNNKTYGLGGYTWEAIEYKVPVIGVAKRGFFANKQTVVEVIRGESKNPLYISSIGIDKEEAAKKIKNMQGNYRIPKILKELDKITKEEV